MLGVNGSMYPATRVQYNSRWFSRFKFGMSIFSRNSSE